jgi:hypothetical protein
MPTAPRTMVLLLLVISEPAGATLRDPTPKDLAGAPVDDRRGVMDFKLKLLRDWPAPTQEPYRELFVPEWVPHDQPTSSVAGPYWLKVRL